uniref:Uncharacterized protein n=1 Tax=Knipowitschia caucasica TaxID=637954 RepID=A0AAV2K941_KNICA
MTDKKYKLAAAVYDPGHKENLLVLRQHVQEQLHINAKQKWRLKEMEEEKLHKQGILDEKNKLIQDMEEQIKTLEINRVEISEKLENANCKIKMQIITLMNMKEELEKSKKEKNTMKIQIKKATEMQKTEQKKKKTLKRLILTLRRALDKQTHTAKEVEHMALMLQKHQKDFDKLIKSTIRQIDFNRSKETKSACLACEVKPSSPKELDDQQNDEACTVEVSSSIYRLEENSEQETETEVMDCTFNHSMEVTNQGLATCDALEKSSSLKK